MTYYPITPVPKPRMTQRDQWQRRPIVLAYRAFKDECRIRHVTLPPAAKVLFFVPMPKRWSRAKRAERRGTPHQQTPDLDNLIKALLDACHQDDSHIWCLYAIKVWSDTGGIEIQEGYEYTLRDHGRVSVHPAPAG